ncbi:MAG: hypothetical protein ACI4Q8_07470 [Ruminococcus sp.]
MALVFSLEWTRSRPLRKCSCGAFLGRSVAETYPLYVNTGDEMEALCR